MSSVIFTPFPCSPPFCFSIAFEIISNPKGIPKILNECHKEILKSYKILITHNEEKLCQKNQMSQQRISGTESSIRLLNVICMYANIQPCLHHLNWPPMRSEKEWSENEANDVNTDWDCNYNVEIKKLRSSCKRLEWVIFISRKAMIVSHIWKDVSTITITVH